MLTIIQGGHPKISSPSLRPRLYLYPGDKGYVGAGSALGNSTGDGINPGAGGDGGDGSAGGRLAESERQVCTPVAHSQGGCVGGANLDAGTLS